MAADSFRVKERDSHDLLSLLLPNQRANKSATNKRKNATLKVYGLVPPLPLGFQDFPFRGSKKEKENFLKSP